MVPENILYEFIPDMICFGVDILICGVIYKVYSKTHTLISAIKVSYFYNLLIRFASKFVYNFVNVWASKEK